MHNFALGQFPVDEVRPIKVVVIGAGYAGIIAGIRFRQRVQNLDFTIYDCNAGVGGTWFANKYPGLRCDIPSHSYQPTFEDHASWSAFYATGPEIQQYLERIVDKYMLRPYIKLQHRVVSAEYLEKDGKWLLTIKRPRNDARESIKRNPPKLYKPNYDDWEEFQDTADVLFTGVGALSRWNWPDIEGLDTFAGKVIHSAQWETGNDAKCWEESVADWNDKKVGVIGVGSSAIQIVHSLQPRVKTLINYVRGKTWISSTFARETLLKLSGGEKVDNYEFTEMDLEAFKDLEYLRKFRRTLEQDINSAIPLTILGDHPPAEEIAVKFKEYMLNKLSKKPWIAHHLIPDFVPGCRRLTPGPGYLEALCENNVDFISALIKRVTPTGIETVDGKCQELDIIICATGFDTSFKLDFDIIGRGGINLNDHHTPYPRTYLAIAVDGFPNMFQSIGPNSFIGAGNILLIMERQVDYAVAATLKLQRERLKSIEVKREAVDEFDKYIDSYFPNTVYGTKCRSWYKAGGKEEGRVITLWPGSPPHAARALEYPRWEDFNYEQLDNVHNRLYWLGNGTSVADTDPKADSAWYLSPENIDYPPVPSPSYPAKENSC